MDELIDQDAARIRELGGPAAVARLLGYAPERGTQRVNNWMTRGVPVRVKYHHPEIFPPVQIDKQAA